MFTKHGYFTGRGTTIQLIITRNITDELRDAELTHPEKTGPTAKPPITDLAVWRLRWCHLAGPHDTARVRHNHVTFPPNYAGMWLWPSRSPLCSLTSGGQYRTFHPPTHTWKEGFGRWSPCAEYVWVVSRDAVGADSVLLETNFRWSLSDAPSSVTERHTSSHLE